MSCIENLAWHRDMVADVDRVRPLLRAIEETVEPGDVVVEVGTGTGILAVAAARAGARRVYAIEAVEEVLAVAREVVADNGVGDRVVLLKGHSTEVELGERADVLIAELVGSLGLEEHIVPYVADARRRLLRPGARMVPDGLRLLAAPTQQDSGLSDWPGVLCQQEGIDMKALVRCSRHLPSSVRADEAQLLGPGATLLDCDLTTQEPENLHGRARVQVERHGELTGWIGWFQMRSAGRLILSTEPAACPPSWGHKLLPAGRPIPVEPGTVAGLDVRFDPPFWSWGVQVGATRRSFSEFEALPPTALTPAGQLQETVNP